MSKWYDFSEPIRSVFFWNVLPVSVDVEMTTIYFVDPELICGTGRSDKQFEQQGTGNLLWLQSGPKYTDVLKLPLTKDEIISQVRNENIVMEDP